MKYEVRQGINERSREIAENYRELWSEEEVAFLEKRFSTDMDILERLAACLGRTVEACRQKHYDLAANAERQAAAKRQVPAWSKNLQSFTSIDKMGY